MKALAIGLFVAFITSCSFAQKSPIKFGEIPLSDLKTGVYAKDSTAAAVILSDYGEAYITFTAVSAVLNFERHVRIKILSKDGFEWADVEVPLYHDGTDEERILKFKASTFNLENGKMVETEVEKSGIFKEKFNRNINFQKFTFPNVKEGSILEYSYTVSSPFLFNFPNWQFQYSIPVQHSEYWALCPDFFFFEKYMQGYIAPTTYEVKNKTGSDFQVVGHHWISKDVPAFIEEPFMTCEDDYVSKINMALSHINFPGEPVREIMGTWSKLNKLLLEDESFGKAITGSGFLKKKVEEITAGISDPEQKVKAIYNYVSQNIEWDGVKDKYADNLKKVFEDKKGTAADINLLFASMVEKANIPVEMVLISTRDHGFIRQQYPMESQLNYALCSVKIGDKTMLIDATDKYLPMGVLPKYCLNGQGLMISATNHGWIAIEPKVKGRTVVNADLALSDSGELTGKVTYSNEGYDAHQFRMEYFKKGETDYLKDFLTGKNWQVNKTEFESIKEVEKAVRQNFSLTIAEHTTVAGDVIYLTPFVSNQVKENIFKLETRVYPVDFGFPIDRTYLCQITIPEGYSVDELPKPKVMVLPNGGGKLTYNIIQNGNKLSITSILVINKSLFVQNEYPLLREFYNQVVAKQAEQIVLKKI